MLGKLVKISTRLWEASVWCVHSKLQRTEFCIKFDFGISFSYVLKLKVISGISDSSKFLFLFYIF